MERKSSVLACVCLLSAFAISMKADDTPDPCTDTAESCSLVCGSATATCVVTLRTSSSSARRVSIKGKSAPLFCADSGTRIKWIVPPSSQSIYALTFNAKHTPFSQSLIVGDGLHPFAEKATNHGGTDRCYVYSFVVCNSRGECQHADPRVVIRGSP